MTFTPQPPPSCLTRTARSWQQWDLLRQLSEGLLGATVQGGRVHGAFPNLVLSGPDDAGSRGVLIPSTSVDQYGATLAAWIGVPTTQLQEVFPNLANFAPSTLGFMG